MARGGNQQANHNDAVRAVRQYLTWAGAWQLKTLGGLGQRPYVPDLLACFKGRFVAVEVKTGGAVLSDGQQGEREQLEAAGALYILARGIDDVEAALLKDGLLERPLTVSHDQARSWNRLEG